MRALRMTTMSSAFRLSIWLVCIDISLQRTDGIMLQMLRIMITVDMTRQISVLYITTTATCLLSQ